MFADHVLRKQESHLVPFQVCRQTKTLFLTVKQPYHKQSATLTKPCNATMIWSLLSRFMSHLFSQLRNTVGSQKKKQGTASNDSFIPHPNCTALQCFFSLKAATPFNSEPVLFTALLRLFCSVRAELLEHICVFNPSRHFHHEGTTAKEWE